MFYVRSYKIQLNLKLNLSEQEPTKNKNKASERFIKFSELVNEWAMDRRKVRKTHRIHFEASLRTFAVQGRGEIITHIHIMIIQNNRSTTHDDWKKFAKTYYVLPCTFDMSSGRQKILGFFGSTTITIAGGFGEIGLRGWSTIKNTFSEQQRVILQ